MRFLSLFIICFLLCNCNAQENKRLLRQELITDYSKYPIYPRLVDEVNGQNQWKPAYQYLDSIELYAITYLSDGLKINGLMAKPKATGEFPSVIWNRGGNRDFGALKVVHGLLFLGKIAKEGYVVIASQYRGNGGSEGKEEFGGVEVNDVTILTEVLQEVEAADTKRVGLYGWSRGGMMTYQALTKMENVKAAVVGGGVSDHFASIKDRPEMETGVLAELVPDYENNKIAELEKRSAIKWVDKFPKDVPILLLHGNSDWRVKSDQSLRLAMEFEKHRIPYRLIVFEGGDHGIREHREEVHEQTIRWFDRFLKNGEALPDMEYHGR